MKKETNNQILLALKTIDNEILNNTRLNHQIGLMGGKMGICIYLSERYERTLDESLLRKIDLILDEIFLELKSETITPTFADGILGIIWGINHLEHKKILEETSIVTKEIKQSLFAFSKSEINTLHWDYLHGGLGGVLALHKQFPKILDEAISILNKNKSIHKNHFFWKSKMYGENINLGLSHGLPSILYFLLESIKTNSNNDTAPLLLNSLSLYIIDQMNEGDEQDYLFNSIVNKPAKSRLAWCYGDLTIGLMLFKSGDFLKNKKIRDKGMYIMTHTTKRKSFKDTMIGDACICHGTSGLALIYKSAYELTKDNIFKTCSDYWVEATLKLFYDQKNIKFYNRHENVYQEDLSLLEGLAGVGLMLNSLDCSDNNWLSCLLLK